MFEEALRVAEQQLQLDLQRAREQLDHSGNKGTRVEVAVRRFLAQHLSRNLDVGHGEIVDLVGRRSAQMDLVIANEHQPFRWNDVDPGIFIVEGVSAAGEVKTQLTTGELADVIRKGDRGERLNRDHPAWSAIGPGLHMLEKPLPTGLLRLPG